MESPRKANLSNNYSFFVLIFGEFGEDVTTKNFLRPTCEICVLERFVYLCITQRGHVSLKLGFQRIESLVRYEEEAGHSFSGGEYYAPV